MYKKLVSLLLLFISNLAQSNEVIWDLTFDYKFNLPFITLNIEGENIILILDTGAKGALYLPIDLIDKIPNKTEQDQTRKSMDLSGNITETRSFTINNLTLNSFLFEKIEVIEYKNWGMSISGDNTENENIDIPVIGLNLFNDYILTINFPESKIIISDETDISADLNKKWIAIPFQLNGEGIVIDMSDGVKNYKMILDSGASTSIIKEQSISSQTARINDDSGYQFIAIEISNIPTDKIEAIIFDSFPTEFQSDGLLGFDFFSKNVVKIDFKNKKLWIKAEEK
ncbi:aspartyl protease family protein [Orbus wheelerorum]|uniref:hypothetical protein n=1 Tax=Orbus wheelerorum TaxID=3074111 RepID=UPI00370DA7AE